MSLYAESSAVLRWLLNEPDPDQITKQLREADRVVSSELTLLECRRMLTRLAATGVIGQNSALRRRGELDKLSARWDVWGINTEVLARATERWLHEPVRSLDSIHLATLTLARAVVPDIRLMSLDLRVRENAYALGFVLVPPA